LAPTPEKPRYVEAFASLASSIMSLVAIAGPVAGRLAERLGYPAFFALAFAASLPGVLLDDGGAEGVRQICFTTKALYSLPRARTGAMISNATGKPVEGEDFFDREHEARRVWERVETDNVLLLAPRRVGKTSLMFSLRDDAGRHRFSAAYLSVADVTSELGFVQRLYDEAQKQLPSAKRKIRSIAKGPLGRFFKRIKKLGFATISIELADPAQSEWAQLGEALAGALDGLEDRWLLLIDELPIFVLNLIKRDPTGASARIFLNWFRQLRIGSRRIRWLLAGSIGLDTVTRRMGFGDTINDLYLFTDFGAFTTDVADDFLDALAKSYRLPLPPEVKARIRERIGWLIPYHLQIVFAELRGYCGDHSVKPTLRAVDAVYESLLLPAKRAYFDYWEQRLKEELGHPDDRQTLDLLNSVAKNPSGEPLPVLQSLLGKHIAEPDERDAKLRYLLDVLQSDGYLVAEDGRFRFRSSLLRDFWQRRIAP
jgi:hypothetical protein